MTLSKYLTLFLALAVAPAIAADANTAKMQKSPNAAQIARGKYLVNNVALCGDCHSPHDQAGAVPADKELHGSELPFKPTVAMPWSTKSPAIAGIKNDQALIALLTGKARLRPPMPTFEMTREDAQAVAAYLKSLKGPAKK